MPAITVDVWLYGEMAQFAGDANQGSFAHLAMELPEGSRVDDLLAALELPTERRGITFINGALSAMPGLQPDLDRRLQDGDRVAIFDPRSMWPFQYRHGAAMTEELSRALSDAEDGGLHHSYRSPDAGPS